MYCRKCGALLPEDSAFCQKCGTEVTFDIPSQSVEGKAVQKTDMFTMPKFHLSRKAGIILGITAFIILLSLSISFSVQKGKQCKYDGCENDHSYGSDYCWRHQCGVDECDLSRFSGSYYCILHTCSEYDCDEAVYNNTSYCYDHQRYSESNPIPVGKVEQVVRDNLENDWGFQGWLLKGAKSIKYFRIASVEKNNNGRGLYPLTVKGTYSTYDSYGELVQRYKYSVDVTVNADGSMDVGIPTVTKN